MKNQDKGILIVVSGFSGAGKGTLMKKLLENYDNYALSVSATTRAPRQGETHGKEYFFKTVEEFEKMIELIKTVSDSNLTQFQIEEDGFKLSMKTDKQSKVVVQKQESVPKEIQSVAIADAEPAEQKEIKKAEGNVVKSPLVGTFYSASSPDSAPFVKVGDTVKKGQVLGIVEAMKLMNEIESEFDGVVKEIQIENEQVVEYGQPLFVIG